MVRSRVLHMTIASNTPVRKRVWSVAATTADHYSREEQVHTKQQPEWAKARNKMGCEFLYRFEMSVD